MTIFYKYLTKEIGKHRKLHDTSMKEYMDFQVLKKTWEGKFRSWVRMRHCVKTSGNTGNVYE